MYNQLLPSKGLLCLAIPNPKGPGFVHKFYSDTEALASAMLAHDAAGMTVYYAQASFNTTENRKGTNVCAVRSFWFDIDCGEGKPYATQREAAADLIRFCTETGLPLPTVVNSGNGLYAHWALAYDIMPDQWKGTASILKKLTAAHDFHDDPMRTADISSVLRPAGSHNRKDPANPKDVVCGTVQPPVDFIMFAAAIAEAAKKKKIEHNALLPPKKQDINAEFLSGMGNAPPSSGAIIADHCRQIRLMKDTLGDIPEPLWYACIGVLRHCSEGEELIQTWSAGHPDYAEEETSKKIAQHILPPTTCAYFGGLNPAGCVGCRHASKVKSPIMLGRKLVSLAVASIDETRTAIPSGFQLTEEGIFWSEDMTRIYKYDIYPIRINFDASLGHETITFRHKQPMEGWKEFTVRGAGILNDPRAFFQALGDNHVQVVGATEVKLMHVYLSNYIDLLRARSAIVPLYTQQGWKETEGERSFVLGEKIYRRGKAPESVGFSKNVPDAIKSFISVGSLDGFATASEKFNYPGDEGFRFNICAGGFGAPLLAFTGFEGALVSCVGESGIGKTLSTRVAQAVYGNPSKLMMFRGDTLNSLVSRLGVYGSLPLTLDEVSNIEPLELSDLVYRITQGRDKARLTKNSVERSYNNSWNTLALVSSNHPLMDKLGALKADAGAEINRIFEYTVTAVPSLNREVCTEVYRLVSDNYGVAGPLYIQYLVNNQEKHREHLDKLVAYISEKANARPEERYQLMVIAVAIYGGLIAQKLGLIRFDVWPVMDWAIANLEMMRRNKRDQIVDSMAILGQFLDKYSANAVIVQSTNAAGTSAMKRFPTGAVVYRADLDTMRCYISRDVLRKELNKNYGSYAKLKYDLSNMVPKPALLRSDTRKVLTQGCEGYVGAQTYTWEIDLTCPQLGMVKSLLLQKVEE